MQAFPKSDSLWESETKPDFRWRVSAVFGEWRDSCR